MKTSAIDSARLRTNLKYSQLTNKEIKRICAQRNLSIYGTRHGLIDRLRRYDALPVMYDSWTKPELVSAVSARKIALRKTKADSATEKGHQRRSKIEIFARCRQTLINALEKADREAEFELMEMPPELRLKVYHFGVASTATVALKYPNKPAIRGASQEARWESLRLLSRADVK